MAKVRVRVAVAVDADGDWNAYGHKNGRDNDMMDLAVECLRDGEARYWLEADLEVPADNTIEAAVTSA